MLRHKFSTMNSAGYQYFTNEILQRPSFGEKRQLLCPHQSPSSSISALLPAATCLPSSSVHCTSPQMTLQRLVKIKRSHSRIKQRAVLRNCFLQSWLLFFLRLKCLLEKVLLPCLVLVLVQSHACQQPNFLQEDIFFVENTNYT